VTPAAPRFEYLLRMGDSALVLAQRLSEWVGKGPVLEEDIALANVGLDLIGQARMWLSYAGEVEGAGRDEDALAFRRDAHQFRNALLCEQPNGNYADTTARQFLFDHWHVLMLRALERSSDARVAEIAAKAAKEVRYHVERSTDWVIRLGDGTQVSHLRMQAAIDALWPYAGELFAADAVDEAMAARRRRARPRVAVRPVARGGERGAGRGDAGRARRRLGATRRAGRAGTASTSATC
jgi:ring-1,2-phenylacetyl-CoA epoxidase subunit PaaC